MTSPKRSAPYVGAILLLIASMVIAWIWVPGGRATSDSSSYLDGARHLAAAEGFVSSHVRIGATAPRPIVDFPLGFSLLLVPGIWAGLDVHQSAALILAISYVAYGLATYCLLLTASRARWPALALVFVAALLLSPSVLLMLDTIGSDLPGATLSIAAAALAFRLIARPAPDLRQSIAVGALFGCAVLTRWSALYLVIPVGLGIVLAAPPECGRRARLQCAGVVLLVALATAAPWILRNYLTTHTLFGYRRIRFADPLSVATDALRGLGGFADAGDGLALLRVGVVAMVAALTLFALARRQAWRHGPVRLALVSVFGYGALLVLSASTSPIDPLQAPRFWLPAWPLLGALVLATASSREAEGRRGIALLPAFAVLLIVGGVASSRAILAGAGEAASGRGFRKPSLVTSAAVAFARRNQGTTLFCNDPRAVLTNAAAPLIYELPPSAGGLEPLPHGAPIAVLFFTETLTPRIEAQLPAHRAMLTQLERDGRLTRIAADAASEVWVSRGPSADR